MLYYIHMKRLELSQTQRAHGFTIVEVVVVIVIIGVLAMMTIVGYSWVTADAKDSARRAAAKDVAKAIKAFSLRKGKIPGFGNSSSLGPVQADGFCPTVSGGGGGWLSPGAYVGGCSVGDMLVAADMIQAEFWKSIPTIPSSTLPTQMIYPCANATALFYYVQNPTSEETATMDSLRAMSTACKSRVDAVQNSYHMRAAIILDDVR